MKSAHFVCGGLEGHEPEKCVSIVTRFLRAKEYDVEISDISMSACESDHTPSPP